MPIATGKVLASPGDRFLRGHPFRSRPLSTSNTSISGATKDPAGAALASCTVNLYRTGDNVMVATTVSDANGNYRFDNPAGGPFYVVAYKTGTPDVAGSTRNDLVPT